MTLTPARSMVGIARWIYLRMPGICGLMDVDDIRQECELQRLTGRANRPGDHYRRIIDLARLLGGRRGQYVFRPLPPDAPAQACSTDRTILVGELLDRLPRQQRRVMELRLEGLESREIAADLGIAVGTVSGHIHAALVTMRGCDA